MMKWRSNAKGRAGDSSDNMTQSLTSRDEEKRGEKSDAPASNLCLRISFGALHYEMSANAQFTFGQLKKALTAKTRLQPGEQRRLFRGKERENGEYLDACGDPASIERRAFGMRRNAKIQTAHRAILDVSMEVDKLAEQVSATEKSILNNGVQVPELQITTLIEMLMRQAIKLDNISAEGDASAHKNLQGKGVQKCVESLDMLKISSAKVKPVVVTTKWATFDPPPTTAKCEFFD
ncbi:BAG family molecular chaperone regulator 3-like [Pyrus ussuriensis x Pyrus communis]|uniref:BAG family molecular chaperone regulator 3-like n=1 Tax=Pyrus ussuriensis x Pyrus communis TaxID=2448454 RepID=A0A5N5FII7_9ROSA|nr:BAG family molecular chaperone regulator 3-like [Pyrus ussuriensis x Pyrus communis]